MKAIQTLSDLIDSAAAQLRVFDLGRRFCKLSKSQFQEFEHNQAPYPFPFQRQAWLGLLVWDPKQHEAHAIWFLKLPLDEQGLLIQAARDDLLARLLQRVGERLLNQEGEEDPLKDNPFAFTPDQEKMAAFHARATQILKQPPSHFYNDCRDYLTGKLPEEHWESLGWQGIADLVARLDEGNNQQALIDHLPKLPGAPLEAFCVNLETVALSHQLTQTLAERLKTELQRPDTTPNRIGALLRSLAQAQPESIRNRCIEETLASQWGTEVEILAAVAGRCWEALNDQDLCMQYLERVAAGADQGAFNALVADLLFMPGMRPVIMGCLRNPQRSEALGNAIGGLFQSAR